MEITSKVDYALVALIELATHDALGKPMKVVEIAHRQGIPDRYLDQIMTTLRRFGIVRSQRGSKGGYLLARSPKQITLLDVMISIEGNNNSKEDKTSTSITTERTVVLAAWQKVIKASQDVLQSITLEDLCQQRDVYSHAEPMFYI